MNDKIKNWALWLLAPLAAGILLAGCAATETEDPGYDNNVSSSTDDTPQDAPDIDLDDLECDDEDLASNETPDCGQLIGNTFVPWSWVQQGKKTAPRGWKPGKELTGTKSTSTGPKSSPAMKASAPAVRAPAPRATSATKNRGSQTVNTPPRRRR